MKHNLLKCGKHVLSLVVAFAVIAVSLFTVTTGVNITASAITATDTWDGTTSQPTQTDADGNIIINTAEEFAWVAFAGTVDGTKDKNYKVTDGAVFDMGGFTDVTIDSTVGDVKLGTVANVGAWNSDNNRGDFAGNFDGNGVIVYNLYSRGKAYGGLFPSVSTDNSDKQVTIKNITVKASYFSGYHYSGGIVGYGFATTTSQKLVIENCKVENSYISYDGFGGDGASNTAFHATSGAIAGTVGHNATTIKNCIIIDNITSNYNISGGFIGNTSDYAGPLNVTKSVAIGVIPYPVKNEEAVSTQQLSNKAIAAAAYNDVYTDQDVDAAYAGVKTVDETLMTGNNAKAQMPALDWNVFIAFDGQYPDLRANHKLTTTSNGATGHTVECDNCGESIVETHNLNENDDATKYVCACGYEEPIKVKRDQWDGTQADSFTKGDGSKNNPYIITNAEQLAYAILSTTLDTKGKYFKVVDNAEFDMNGMVGITTASTAADVKAASKKDAYQWGANTATFNGHFDGNGVVIYNLYAKSGADSAYAALFPYLNTDNDEKTVNISGITLKASYVQGYHYAAGIVGYVKSTTTTQFLNIDKCVVENCHITDNNNTNSGCNRTSATIAGNVSHCKTTVTNCMAKNNLLEATDVTGGFIGSSSAYTQGITVASSISIGTLPYSVVSEGSTATGKIQPKAIDAGNFTGVYTDKAVAAAYAGIKTLALADMQGAGAKAKMPELDWGTWIVFDGEYPDYRSNHELNTVSNGKANHTTSCEDCGKSVTETHNLKENDDKTLNVCECGYEEVIKVKKGTWNGTQDNTFNKGSGTEKDPYIIETPEQLAFVALSTELNSAGVYFKVVDNAEFNMNGMVGITLNSTAADVKTAAKKDAFKWNSDGSKFAGYIDGNGAVIYNLYSKGAHAALFPRLNTDNADKAGYIKNFKVASSYFDGYHYATGILAYATSANTGHTLDITSCAVENCYMTDHNDKNDQCQRTVATIVGNASHHATTLDACFAKGNILEATDIIGGFVGNLSGSAPAITVKNSISIGTKPYAEKAPGSAKDELQPKAVEAAGFTGVYTDMTVSKSYEGITTIAVDDMKGKKGLNAMTGLDFASAWFANAGLPELQAFHNLKGAPDATDPAKGHSASCEDCGLEGINVLGHDFTSDTCTACGYVCKNHEFENNAVIEKGDCVTPAKIGRKCKICKFSEQGIDDPNFVKGHKFTEVNAKKPTCLKDGNIAYKKCDVCTKFFPANAKDDAAMSEAIESVVDPKIPHEFVLDSDGNPVYVMDGSYHYKYCKLCKKQYDKAAHEGKSFKADGANGHTGACEVCFYAIDEVTPHVFGNDSVCDTCAWECKDHDTVDGLVLAEGDCVTDRVVEQRCSICDKRATNKVTKAEGHKFTKIKGVAATCTKEGRIEHWSCKTCKKLYDSDDKMAPLSYAIDEKDIVAEKLPHDFIDTDKNGNPVYDKNDTHHWYNCRVCGKGEYSKHTFVIDESGDGVYKMCEDAEGNNCGLEFFEYKIADETLGVTVTAPENAFTKDVITDFFQITEEDTNFKRLSKKATNAGLESFVLYEFSPNEEIAKGCKATVTMVTPLEYSINVAVYYLNQKTGELEKLNAKIFEDKEEDIITATFDTDKFGVFVIADATVKYDNTVTPDDNTGDNNDGNTGDNNGSTPDTDNNGTGDTTPGTDGNNGAGDNSGTGDNATPDGENGGDANTDSNPLSPENGESVIAIAIIALLAAAIVFARKVVRNV